MAAKTSGRSRQQTKAKQGIWSRFNCRENTGFGLRFPLLLPLVLALPSCDASETASGGAGSAAGLASVPPSMAEPIDTAAFAEAFEVVGELSLEENDRAMVVEPMVSSDGSGLLLLAEPLEGQVNLYGTDGSFKAVVGRKGEAPGEFQLPLAANRARNGEILIADMMLQRITIFPADEGGDPEVVASPIPMIVGVQELGNGRYLLSGADSDRPRPRLLHIWNRESASIERSFLPVGVPERVLPAAASFTASSATIEGDTIWAVWALSDSLYKFDRRGERLAVLPLPLPRPGDTRGITGAPGDPREMQRAFDSVTQVYRAFALGNGDKVIASMQTRGFDSVWDLLIIDRQGALVWRATNMPRLMTVDDGLFYFRHPDSSLPNRWLVARRSVDAGRQTPALSPGDSIPLSDLSAEHPTLVWVLDAQDCLGCELTGPAHSVRLLQRRLGDRMETVVVALSELGDEDRSLVTRFLDSQRVSADVRVRKPGEHVREFGQGPVPAFYVVDRQRAVQALLEPGRWDLWRSPEDSLRLADYVETLAEEPTMPVERSRQ